MNTTEKKVNDKSHRLLKSGAILTLTFLLLTGGTAYAGHRHNDYNSGLSISLGYIFYPQVELYQDSYRHPRRNHHYDKHDYRGGHGYGKSWKHKHSRKHGRKHARKHARKHHRKHHHGHYDH